MARKVGSQRWQPAEGRTTALLALNLCLLFGGLDNIPVGDQKVDSYPVGGEKEREKERERRRREGGEEWPQGRDKDQIAYNGGFPGMTSDMGEKKGERGTEGRKGQPRRRGGRGKVQETHQ